MRRLGQQLFGHCRHGQEQHTEQRLWNVGMPNRVVHHAGCDREASAVLHKNSGVPAFTTTCQISHRRGSPW